MTQRGALRDESALIRAASSGDRGAFGELVKLKRERVVRVAYQITGDWEDASDVAQGVFIRLWKGLGRYDPGRRFDTWLYRVTTNAAIDFIRNRGPKGTLQPLPDEAGSLVAPGQGAEERIDAAELQRAFLRLAARLAPKQRTAFVLREVEGLETAEVARVMGVAESTVRNHLLQARRVLKAGLEQDYPGFVPRAHRTSEGEEGR